MTELQIWDWFSKNNKRFVHMIESESADHEPYEEFTGLIQKYNENLFPEVTGHVNGKYVLVITCDGRREGIPYVEKLCNAFPGMDNWIVQKFRKPGYFTKLNFKGLEFSIEQIRIKFQPSGSKYDVDILISNYDPEDDRYKSLAFLYLDHFIGEYHVMTRVGHIEFGPLKEGSNSISMTEFREMIHAQLN